MALKGECVHLLLNARQIQLSPPMHVQHQIQQGESDATVAAGRLLGNHLLDAARLVHGLFAAKDGMLREVVQNADASEKFFKCQK